MPLSVPPSPSLPLPPHFRGAWHTDLASRAVYAEAAGIHRVVPRAIAVPRDADDVQALVLWAAKERVPITARGSGSSMAGGAVGSGVIVDLSALGDISVQHEPRRVIAGPGAVCADIDRLAHECGLRVAVDPSSAAFCTIGGMAATNAAGARTLRFGPMRAWVRGIECVFADGTRAWVRRGAPPPSCAPVARFETLAPALKAAERTAPSRHAGVRKESSGYGLADWASSGSLVDVLVGSEGTLALFTAVELELIPVVPASATVLATFASLEAAVTAAAIAAELNAGACELLDRTFLDVARESGPIPVADGTEAVLLVELEESTAARLAEVARAIALAYRDAGATHVETALDGADAARLWEIRHAASPTLAALAPDVTSMQLIEDGAVPPLRLAEYVRGVREALARAGFRGVLFGHAGDGHIHANVLVRTADDDWRERLERLFSETVSLTRSLGGTLTGEHGDGRLRAGAMNEVWPAAVVGRFRQVKSAFDPDGVLNPGVKFAAPGAPPFGAPCKYDPAVEALPGEARRVLDRVQRERAWNRSRLEMLAEESSR